MLALAAVAATIAGCAPMQPAPSHRPHAFLAERALPPGHFVALSYHDVVRDLREAPARDAVETSALAQQFDWLRQNGYEVIGIDELLAAERGERPLPAKAVLLSFDDGYRSFYTQVYPLLKAFGYKAVLAVVGSWLEAAPGTNVGYDGASMPRSRLLDWNEIREMTASGLVEIASHSYDAHRGLRANVQGNTLPALTTRELAADGARESESQWRERVRADLRRNSALIEQRTGHRPRVIVWPYGSYSGEAQQIAAALGMPVGLTLDAGANAVGTHLARVRRKYVDFNPDIGHFAAMVRDWDRTPELIRPIHVDLDYVYDADPRQQERNLDALVERVKAARAGTVFLQAFADPDGNGAADALYFPSRHLPMRADLFARAAWQLHTRAGVEVYGWLPLLAFELPAAHPAAAQRVEVAVGGTRGHPRLTPYSAQVRETVREIYAELGQYAFLAGLLIHDDATLSDFEDASRWGAAHRRAHWGLPESVAEIRADAAALARWSRLKTEHLTRFALDAADAFRARVPNARIARNYYARPVLEPEAEQWFAQRLTDGLAHFDWVALMAMPYMEGAGDDARSWLRTLVERVAAEPGGLDRVVFQIQTRDWRDGRPLPAPTIAAHLRWLQAAGARSIGYYPDDFLHDHPPLEVVRPIVSVHAPRSMLRAQPR